jgi:hypothetical protein
MDNRDRVAGECSPGEDVHLTERLSTHAE